MKHVKTGCEDEDQAVGLSLFIQFKCDHVRTTRNATQSPVAKH